MPVSNNSIIVFFNNRLSFFVFKNIRKKFGSCPAANGLLAQKNFGTVKLTWSGSGASYNYGGYYNYRTSDGGYGSANFSGSTAGNYANITVPSTTYSLTYQVSTVCTDGSITGSAGPASFNF